jgi:hypothetical protein
MEPDVVAGDHPIQEWVMEPSKSTRLMSAVIAAICTVPAVWSPASAVPPASPSKATAAASAKTCEFDIDSSEQWVDSNIDLRAEEKLHISASGTVTYPTADASKLPAKSFGAAGLVRCRDARYRFRA